MHTVLTVLILAAMAAVALVLILGVGAFAKTDEQGRSDGHRQNRLMRWRIGLQFLAVVLIMALIWLSGS